MTRADHARALAHRAARLDAGEEEAWATVNGFSRYEVSSWGFVRNRKSGRILKPFVHDRAFPATAYLRVSLYKASGPNRRRPFHRFVHRLVALYHVPGRTRHRYEVHHLPDPETGRPDLADCAAGSLVWVTPEENRRCRGVSGPGVETGPARTLADVRAEIAAEAEAWRAERASDPTWIPTTTEIPF
ncbi:MAG: hypothetical protein CMM84_16275 [Rhodothermaceae bacterium]|nr:hypothetical protein [Rhodothermaceae bacterium]MAQ95072.1 hypothetical protein [Rhodothermaceae bacterium]MBC12498.1 hypothetical protein [Rhodothermaceae bacterium]